MDRNRLENAYRLEDAGRRLLRWWGALFRTGFIAAIGVFGYSMLDPPSIGDTPISALTLTAIGRNLFSWLIAIGCINWFFRFPNEEDDDNVLSHADWGKFGGWVAFGAVMIAWFIIGQ